MSERDILVEYLDIECDSELAKWNLDQIEEAQKKKWAEADLGANIHDITVNLLDEKVHIAGLMAEDPEKLVPLEEFIELMNKVIHG